MFYLQKLILLTDNFQFRHFPIVGETDVVKL